MPTKLPCTNCGSNLDIIKGSIIQCFSCGIKNVHFDSYETLSGFVQDLFGYPKAIDEIEKEIKQKDLNQRIEIVHQTFAKNLAEINNVNLLVVSKIYPNDTKDMLNSAIRMSKQLGLLKIVIDSYILPHIKGLSAEKQYYDYSATCDIYQLVFLGLRHTIEAKENYKPEASTELYERARRNYENAKELALKYQASFGSTVSIDFSTEVEIFKICEEFCSILKDCLNENPVYFSDSFENLIASADKIQNNKSRNLKNELQKIYEIGNELPKVLEEIRVSRPIVNIDPNREKILYHMEEYIEDLTNTKLWLTDIVERFKNIQIQIMKLHSGQLITYLKDIRQEFYTRETAAIERYNILIGKIVQTSLLDYTLSITDLLEEMENALGLFGSKAAAPELISKVRFVKKDILGLDDDLKQFLFEIIKFGINQNLQSVHSLSIVSSISEKHSSFDRLILKYIKKLLDEFIFERDQKRYTMEEQRNKFNIEIRPIFENLIKTSFTLKEEDVPFPVFMEVVMLSTQLEVEKDYKVFLVLENPAPTSINNVSATFFVPNSFRIKLREYTIGKLKPGQRLNVETRIIPQEAGIFHFMAMIQYEYSTEMFWMPGLQIKLKVLDSSNLNAQFDEDAVMNEIYKKYGQVANQKELEAGEFIHPNEKLTDLQKELKPKIDHLMPQIDEEDDDDSDLDDDEEEKNN